MKNTRRFIMNGKQYNSMMEIARELGLKRVYPRDFEKLGITEIENNNDTVADSAVDDVVVNSVTDDVAIEDSTDVDVNDDEDSKETVKEEKKEKTKKEQKKSEKKSDDSNVDKRFTRKTGTKEQIKEVKDNISNMSLSDFCSYIKHFKLEALEELAVDAGVNDWSSISNEPIRKMRLQMELKAHYFPNEKTQTKASSIWKKVSLDKLTSLADEHNLEYKVSNDPKIQRMWVVVALNKAGLTLQDLK